MRILFILLSAGFISCANPTENTNSTTSEQTEAKTGGEIKLLSAKEFHDATNQKEVVLLDVRTPEEFADGHLENSVNIDINDMNSFSEKVSSLDKETPVYVYCRSGGRSNRAAEYLKEQGFSLTHDLDGGITKWTSEGYETVK